jgi:hypothetical protein
MSRAHERRNWIRVASLVAVAAAVAAALSAAVSATPPGKNVIPEQMVGGLPVGAEAGFANLGGLVVDESAEELSAA